MQERLHAKQETTLDQITPKAQAEALAAELHRIIELNEASYYAYLRPSYHFAFQQAEASLLRRLKKGEFSEVQHAS